MLSIQRCRAILGADAPESDQDVEQLRDQLYAIASIWVDGGTRIPASPSAGILASLSEDARAEIEERAALMEFDGGLARSLAERAALSAFKVKIGGRIH